MTFQRNQVFEAFPGKRMSPLSLIAEAGKEKQVPPTPQKHSLFHFQYTKKKKKSKVDSAINTRQEEVDTEHDVPEIIIQILSVFPMYTVLFLCTHTGLPSFTKDYKPSSKPINPTTQGFGLAPSIICSPCALWVIKKE